VSGGNVLKPLPLYIDMLECALDLTGAQFFGWPTQPASPLPCGIKACLSSFANEITFEFGEGRHDVKDQPSARGAGVDRFIEGLEFTSLCAQIVDKLHQISQGPAEPIQSPNYQRVPGAKSLYCCLQTGALHIGACGPVILVHFVAAGRF